LSRFPQVRTSQKNSDGKYSKRNWTNSTYKHGTLIVGKITGSVIDWSPEKPRAFRMTL
jgi:hypothetical protein